jgi:hypothetical protein
MFPRVFESSSKASRGHLSRHSTAQRRRITHEGCNGNEASGAAESAVAGPRWIVQCRTCSSASRATVRKTVAARRGTRQLRMMFSLTGLFAPYLPVAIEWIAQVHDGLGHLSATISQGLLFRYTPEREMDWSAGAGLKNAEAGMKRRTVSRSSRLRSAWTGVVCAAVKPKGSGLRQGPPTPAFADRALAAPTQRPPRESAQRSQCAFTED